MNLPGAVRSMHLYGTHRPRLFVAGNSFLFGGQYIAVRRSDTLIALSEPE